MDHRITFAGRKRARVWSGLGFGLIGIFMTVSVHSAQLSSVTTYHGLCDASGAVALTDDLFVVADDEDNKLRVYRSRTNGPPTFTLDTSSFLTVDPEEPEIDLEGAARIGDRVYWITSHGRNRNAKYRESRLRFFATDIVREGASIRLAPVGRYYSALLRDLFADRRLSRFQLEQASHHAPKTPGGLNIEGLCSTPKGELLIGFRNPVPRQGALVVPLLNPADAIEGKPLQLGAPMLLDLGGRGIRSMAQNGDRYVIIGGAFDAARKAKLYYWNGGSAKPEPINVDLRDFNPEALAAYSGLREFQIFSDDGTRVVNGTECKRLPASQRMFRAAWVVP